MFVRRLGGTDDTFLAAYPEVNTMRVSDLLEVIQGKNGQRGKSQNGIPEQRYRRLSPELTTTSNTMTAPSGIEDTDKCM